MMREVPRRLVDETPPSEEAREVQALLRAVAGSPRPISTEARHRMWFRISKDTQARPPARPWRFVFAVPIAMATLAAALVLRLERPASPAPTAHLVAQSGGLEVSVDGGGWRRARAEESLALPARVRGSSGTSSALRLSTAVDLEIHGGSVLVVGPRRVSLESGAVFSSVRPGGGRFVIEVGENQVVVHGTEFWTARSGDDAAVCLLRGRVEVVGPSGRLAWLAPGEGWRSSSTAPSFPDDLPCRVATPAPAPAASAVATVPLPRSRAAAPRHDAQPAAPRAPAPLSAADPLEAPSQPSALATENTLYRLGESRRRAGDVQGALEAWLDYQRRFPGGTFAEEVDLSVLETELRLGSPGALDAAERYLVLWPASHRAPDVHGLYGSLLFRAGRHVEALAEYERALASGPSAPRRDEALYGRAACLDRLGRAGATDAYRAYLAELPEGRFAARARAALGEADVTQ